MRLSDIGYTIFHQGLHYNYLWGRYHIDGARLRRSKGKAYGMVIDFAMIDDTFVHGSDIAAIGMINEYYLYP
jgi:hypothetical protein